jgi:hypothetical protein
MYALLQFLLMVTKEDKSLVIADRITLALEVIGWSLIGAVLLFALLKVLGVVLSSAEL